MSDEIPTAYDPKSVEDKWIQFWKENQFFKANNASDKPPFSIVMPPPNVTGILHMGHVLGTTLQDIVSRYKRMKGFEVLWVPGTDHAGIATQTVVERALIQKENKRRVDLNRKDFEKLCLDWSLKHKSSIIEQIENIGASCDFTRLKFTMDPEINQAVLTLFKKLYEDNLIYRGYYLVNWDPVTKTALADDEVEYEERKGHLYHIKYPIAETDDYIVVATTRPETLLGDTAVAINPKDERYAPLLGKHLKLPLTNRLIPIIADHHVDKDFGTGAVKVTPAHDPNDYEIGQRHNLPRINLMTPDGKLNENGGVFEGLSMEDARYAVAKKLQALGLLLKKEPHTHRVGLSYRSKAVIEPYLSKQWFIRMSFFADKLKAAVESGAVELMPDNWKNTYFHWIDNLRDWCISRQLWWGHRIPIWYHKDDPEKMICHIDNELPEEIRKNPSDWRQDEDVLDTWFSSALWPFSTLGWPEKTGDLNKFYPNSLLITGNDILFFWVARMLMMGEYAENKLPFPKVILTGLIYGKSYWRKGEGGTIHYVDQKERLEYDLGKAPPKDVHSKWEKISKSKGNAIDPKEISDLYGTCAMRMALCSTSCQLRQIDLDRRRFEEFKNFTNKIWNGARFVLMHLKPLQEKGLKCGLISDRLRLEDKWILLKLNETIVQVNQALDEYIFDQAANQAYEFYWNDFCAYYLEIAKPYLFGKAGDEIDQQNKRLILMIVLLSSIRLLHPMTPFITEELFAQLKNIFNGIKQDETLDTYTQEAMDTLAAKSCMVAPFPEDFKHENLFKNISEDFSFIQEVIYSIRNIRGEMKIAPSVKTDFFFYGTRTDFVKEHLPIIQALVPVSSAHFETECNSTLSSSATLKEGRILIPLPQELIEQEKKRLLKEEQKRLQNLEVLNKKLSNPNFVEKAPKELVEKQKALIHEQEEALRQIKDKLERL